MAPIILAAAAVASLGVQAYSLHQASQGTPGPDIPTAPAMPTFTFPEAPTVTAPEQAKDITQPVPTRAESAVASQAATALRQRRGRASTLLSGPGGLYTANPTTSSPLSTLLGS